MHFHTVCMSIKLALTGQRRLRNVRIDDLWDAVRSERIDRTEWREFATKRLLRPSTASVRMDLAGALESLVPLEHADRLKGTAAAVQRACEGTVDSALAALNGGLNEWKQWQLVGRAQGEGNDLA